MTDSNHEILNDTGNDERYYFHVIEQENASNDSDMGSIDETGSLYNCSSFNESEIDDLCESLVYDIDEVYKEYDLDVDSLPDMTTDLENQMISPDLENQIEQENACNDSDMESSDETGSLYNCSSFNESEIDDLCESLVYDNDEVYKEYDLDVDSLPDITMDLENQIISPDLENQIISPDLENQINYPDLEYQIIYPDLENQIIYPDIIDSINQTDPVVNLTPDKQKENSEIFDNGEQNNIIDLIEISDEDENYEQETSHTSNIVKITSIHKLEHAKNVRKILPLFKKKMNFTLQFLDRKHSSEQVNPEIKSSNGYQLKIGDLLSLITPETWLNDIIIQNYISLLISYCDQNVLELNTDFLISYKRHGYNSIYKWFKIKYPSLNNYKRIVIPINPDSNHWALLVVEIWEGKIYCADSFNHLNMEEMTLASEFLNQIFIDYFQNSSVNRPIPSNWKYEKWNSPNQLNNNDCGVFTCTNARYLLFDKFPDYTQADIPLLRHRIAWELLNNTIIPF